MRTGEFDDVGADALSYSLRPLGVDDPILTADDGGAAHRRVLGQRARHRPRVSRLRPKVIDGRCDGGRVTVGIEHPLDEIEVDQFRSHLLIGLAQTLQPSVRKIRANHVGLGLPFIEQAHSAHWNGGAQIHQMAHWVASCNRRSSRAGHRVTDQHHVVGHPVKRGAHRIRVSIEVRRSILARQFRRDHAVTRLLQQWGHHVPTPWAVPGTVHQGERRHAGRIGNLRVRCAETARQRPDGSPGAEMQ
jgi:hypothetical protein